MTIKEAERQSGVPTKTIRFYGEKGLICPKRNMDNGYRVFSEADIGALKIIKHLRTIDFSLEMIAEFFDHPEHLPDMMIRHIAEIERKMEQASQVKRMCRQFLGKELSDKLAGLVFDFEDVCIADPTILKAALEETDTDTIETACMGASPEALHLFQTLCGLDIEGLYQRRGPEAIQKIQDSQFEIICRYNNLLK